jgi:hypothetical protein
MIRGGATARDSAPDDRDGGGDSVHHGHPDVHQHDLGTRLLHHRDGLDPVAGLTDEDQVGLGLHEHPDAGTEQRLVVDEADPDHVGIPTGSTVPTTHWFPSTPAELEPPARMARSRMPTRP